jgi:hypothetical protein
MTFAATLREDILINRRSRARKARIAGRVIGFALTACLVVALRTEPQLRALVQDLALAAMGATAPEAGGAANAQADAISGLGYAPQSEEAQVLHELGISGGPVSGTGAQTTPVQSQMPQSRIKVNRGVSQ